MGDAWRRTAIALALLGLGALVLACVIYSFPQYSSPISAGSVKVIPMHHWHLSGVKARSAMANYFRTQEVHSEANHLEDYVDAHPFLGDKPRPSQLPAINRDARKFRIVGFSSPRHVRKVQTSAQHRQFKIKQETGKKV